MNRLGVLLPAVLILLGCTAQMVSTRKRQKGPVPEVGVIDAGGGHIRYALKGPKSLVRKRRKNAYKKMAEYCEGMKLVRVLKEYTSDDVETPYHVDDLDADKLLDGGHYRIDAYRHIEFECVRKP